MSGAQTSMALQDRMSGPLMKIMKAMDRTISVMEKMDQTAGSIDTKGLAKARSEVQSASADMERFLSQSNSASKAAAATAASLKDVGGVNGLSTATKDAQQATQAIEVLNTAAMSTRASLDLSGQTAGLQQTSTVAKSTAGSFYTLGKAADKASVAETKLSNVNSVLASNAVKSSTWMTRLRDKFTQLPQPIERSMSAVKRFHTSLKNKAGNQLDRIKHQFLGLPGPVNSASSAVRNFFTGFAGAAAAYLSIQGIANGFKKFVGASDTFVSTAARLDLINDKMQTQVQLQDKIYNAAQRSRSAYVDMADSVAKLNLLAGDAFGSNDEAIRFSELMGKAFTVSGAGTSERQAGMHQLTQAMASGRLQGDEFVSINENAPLLAEAIADAMGVSRGELKKLSSEGKITADIIKSALFKASDDIEAKFKTMPRTFGQTMTAMKNWALFAFEPLLKRFNDFVNSDAFTVLAGHVMWFVNVFIAGMTFMFDVLETIYNEVGAIGQMLSDSWAVVGPVILVAAAALGTYLAVMAAYRTVLIVTAAIEGARALALSVTAAAAMMAAGATFAMTVAQYGLNAAVLAFPGTWILIAFIAIIVLVIYAMIAWGDTMAIIFGAIVGGIYWLGAAFTNVMMGIGNFCIMVGEWFVNIWNQAFFLVQLALIGFNLGARKVLDAIGNAALKTAEWFANTWNGASYAVQMGFHKMLMFVTSIMGGIASGVVGTVNSALGAISNLINGAVKGVNAFIGLLNNVLGTDLSTVGTVDLKLSNAATNFTDKLQSNLYPPTKAEQANFGTLDTAGDYAKGMEMPSAPVKKTFDRLEYTSTSDAYDRGNKAGAGLSNKISAGLNGVVDKVSGFLKGPDVGKGNPLVPGNIPNGMGGADDLAKKKNPTGGKLDKVGKIEKDINIAEEDIKMLRDLAEIKSIQNFVTLTPSVTFGDTTVREEADIGKIMKKIENYFEGEMKNSVDGVYA